MAEQMKPSGIDWIGEIPCSWNIKRIKYLAQLKGRIGWQGLTSDEYTDVGPFLITGVDFSNGGINWENCVHITEERWAEAPEIHIKNGDLLITKDGTVGKVAIVENLQGKASLNSGVLLIKTSNDYNKNFCIGLYCRKNFGLGFDLKMLVIAPLFTCIRMILPNLVIPSLMQQNSKLSPIFSTKNVPKLTALPQIWKNKLLFCSNTKNPLLPKR